MSRTLSSSSGYFLWGEQMSQMLSSTLGDFLFHVQRSREFEKGRWKWDQISSRSWFIKAGRLFRLRLLQRSTWLALVAWDGRTAAVIEWSIQATNQQDPYFSSSTCKSFMPPKKIIHSFRWIENRFEKFMHKWHSSNDWGLSLTALDRVFATAEIKLIQSSDKHHANADEKRGSDVTFQM